MGKIESQKVAVIGCGAIGKRHVEILTRLGVKNLLVCDNAQWRLDEIQKSFPQAVTYLDYHDALKENPFAVFILTPTKMHIPMALEALRAGAHVFVEKPLSNSSEGVEELKKACRDSNKTVMVGFCFRHHETLVKAKKMLEQGRIGRLVSVRALMGEDFPSIHPEYKEMYLSKYSGAFELVHDLDLAIWFAGSEPEEVYGVYGAFSDYEFEAPDTVEILLKFKTPCTATVHLDFFQTPRRRQMELIGTKGVITVDFASWDEAVLSVYEKEKGCWERETMQTRRNDMFFSQDREFLECALDGTPVWCGIEEAVKSLAAVEKIYKPY